MNKWTISTEYFSTIVWKLNYYYYAGDEERRNATSENISSNCVCYSLLLLNKCWIVNPFKV